MNKQIVVTALLAVLLGLAVGYWLAEQPSHMKMDIEELESSDQEKVLYWRNPMNPMITSPVFTQDEMGMDYIPVYAEADKPLNEPSGSVSITANTVQNIGVRSAIVRRQSLSREVHALGRVTYDERRLTRLHPKTEGWIEELYIDKTGEQVGVDTMLLSIYSPKLVSSQQEYLLALKNWQSLKESPYAEIRSGAEALMESARERLELLDVPQHQLADLQQYQKIEKNLHIHSPFSGVVMNVGARKGQYVTPQTELYMLADLSKVWVIVDIYEDELPWVSVGDPAEMRVTARPGQLFEGKLTYVYPFMEAQTRTVKVRLEFDNPGLVLKPDMFADVVVHSGQNRQALVVPSEAIIRSGHREQVFVQRSVGKFEPREVRLGLSASGYTEILQGVEEGEQVVTSSQFLIDSESKLREATAKMLQAAEMPAAHDMSAMDMKEMGSDEMDVNHLLDMGDMTMEMIEQEAGHDHVHH